MATDLTTSTQGRRAFDALAPRLAAIPDHAIHRPHTDPHAAAVTALLVSDWLVQQRIDVDEARDLGAMARAIVMLVRELGGDYLRETHRISEEVIARGHDVRKAAMAEIEASLPPSRELQLWMDALRRSKGSVDLVYDLRTLAELHTANAAALPASLARLASILRPAADAIEAALRADERPEQKAARGSLARLWTLFVPAYERAAARGRATTKQVGAERNFPPLALIAAYQRARRRIEHERERGRVTEPPVSTGRYDVVATVDIVRSEPPPPAESRRAPRAIVELEVGISSESNFYVGFTENLSAAGVFVATYATKPIGSRLEIALTMPDGQTMRVPGTVKWLRTAAAEDWPGMGVEFERLSPDDEKRIQRFLALREPIFFDA